jgi:hypothetical protein
MPWKLFDELYTAHLKRKAIERVNRMREIMITGIWGNSNYDPQKKGEESPRTAALKHIEQQFEEAVMKIRGVATEYDGFDKENPFFAAMKVPEIELPPNAEEIAWQREQMARAAYSDKGMDQV